MNDILKKLGIKDKNYGCGIGGSESFATGNGGVLESFNPTTGEKLAEIQMCSEADYRECHRQVICQKLAEWRPRSV